MKVIRLRKPLTELRQDVRDLYGEEGVKQFDKVKYMNPLSVLLDFFPYLESAYTDYFKKKLYEQYQSGKGDKRG